MLLMLLVIANALGSPPKNQSCSYDGSWLSTNLEQQGSACTLQELEAAIEQRVGPLSELRLDVLNVWKTPQGEVAEGQEAFVIVTARTDVPFDGRMQSLLNCNSLDLRNWECLVHSEQRVIYEAGLPIKVLNMEENEAYRAVLSWRSLLAQRNQSASERAARVSTEPEHTQDFGLAQNLEESLSRKRKILHWLNRPIHAIYAHSNKIFFSMGDYMCALPSVLTVTSDCDSYICKLETGPDIDGMTSC